LKDYYDISSPVSQLLQGRLCKMVSIRIFLPLLLLLLLLLSSSSPSSSSLSSSTTYT
uniref:Ovule protein n=1 Tax=Schistocephalus solidus TaxID=70667 RepID=A0A183TUP1_SCHSO